MLKIREGYTFDDVLLVPKYSEVDSRKNINLSTNLGKGIILDIPIINANMLHIAAPSLCHEIILMGGLAILHRFYNDPVVDQIEEFKSFISANEKYVNYLGVSVGVQKDDYIGVDKFVDAGVKIICVDVAHGNSKKCLDIVKYIANKYPNILLIAGNVATKEGAENLHLSGANVVKINIGAGSTCSTRIEAGAGVPQLTALSNVYDYVKTNKDLKIIADGGMKTGADLVKSLCFSHAVMIGNLFAGTDESFGDIINVNGQLYKPYEGSSTFKSNHVEGIKGLVRTKGPIKQVIQKLLESTRSGLSYQGAHNLEELRKDPEFVSITNAGLIESRPHDILVR